jgi:hypothetical protein
VQDTGSLMIKANYMLINLNSFKIYYLYFTNFGIKKLKIIKVGIRVQVGYEVGQSPKTKRKTKKYIHEPHATSILLRQDATKMQVFYN